MYGATTCHITAFQYASILLLTLWYVLTGQAAFWRQQEMDELLFALLEQYPHGIPVSPSHIAAVHAQQAQSGSLSMQWTASTSLQQGCNQPAPHDTNLQRAPRSQAHASRPIRHSTCKTVPTSQTSYIWGSTEHTCFAHRAGLYCCCCACRKRCCWICANWVSMTHLGWALAASLAHLQWIPCC